MFEIKQSLERSAATGDRGKSLSLRQYYRRLQPLAAALKQCLRAAPQFISSMCCILFSYRSLGRQPSSGELILSSILLFPLSQKEKSWPTTRFLRLYSRFAAILLHFKTFILDQLSLEMPLKKFIQSQCALFVLWLPVAPEAEQLWLTFLGPLSCDHSFIIILS